MANVTITPQSIVAAGLTPAYTAVSSASDVFYMNNNEKSYLEVVNGSASPVTVTVTAVGTCDQGTLHDLTVSVAAGARAKIGTFPRYRFNQNSGSYIGAIKIGFSASTSITYGGFTL